MPRSAYAKWSWLRSYFTKLGWNELEELPRDVTDERLDEALGCASLDWTVELFAKTWGLDRVFVRLLARKEKGLTPHVARVLILQAGDALSKCQEAAEAAWATNDALLHMTLAYAFFENDDWRRQALAEVLKEGAFSNQALSLARTEDEVRALLAKRDGKQHTEYCEIVADLEDEALPLLMELAKEVRKNEPHLSHALALSLFKDRKVAEHLAAHLTHPTTRGVIGDYFERYKDLAEAVLPRASEGASRNAALVKALAIKLLGAAAEDAELAPADDEAIPEVLRDPPWRRPVEPPPAIKIDLAAYVDRVVLPDGIGADALAWMKQMRGTAPEMNADEAKTFSEMLSKQTYWTQWTHETKAVPLDIVLEGYNRGIWARWGQIDDGMLITFKERALPGFLRDVGAWQRLSPAVLRGIDSAKLAMPHAHLVMQPVTSWSKNPWIWIDAQPRAAAWGLLAAVGDPATRTTAEIVLRQIGAKHRDAVLAVGKEVGELAWVTALLDRDPRLDFTAPPKVDLHPATRPKLADGRALPDPVVRALYEMIALSSIHAPYAGFDDVRAACDEKSLSDMSWDLAALAEGGGRSSQARRYSDWLRWAVVHFADDAVIRRLTPALKHPTIYRSLEALAAKGSRIAMMEIATAHEREDPQGRSSMQRIAERGNLTVAEVVESILPTTPLSAEGHTELAYGKRMLRVGFDTTLTPVLFHDDTRLATLPRAKKGDDAVAIRLAKERWDELKEDVRTIASLRCRELNTLLRTRQTLPASRFMQGWAHHPLGKHLARGMVWGVLRNDALVSFRVAEDSSLADFDDGALVLGDTEEVIVPHPLELGRASIDRWSTVFVDYGLIQPIHQLERTPFALAPGDDKLDVIEKPANNISRAAFDRVLAEQGFTGTWSGMRALVRGQGNAYVHPVMERVDGKRKVARIRVEVRDGSNVYTKLEALDERDRAEILFTLRLLLEAS